MERRRDGIVYYALVVAIIALIISLVAYVGRENPEVTSAPRSPTTMTLSMVVATFSGQGVAAHRWHPTMLVVRQGDTVDLAVANPDEFSHQLEITGYNLKTKKLTPGSSDRLQFVADQAGIFVFQCALPHDPAWRHCTPDHELMRGYLIVTE
ncbi:MAG: cupredoxin domain-containing protein [Armatimonadetes bacterium]|nr:cupredoxin domain-containing protein [Armatimonadota bacterium]